MQQPTFTRHAGLVGLLGLLLCAFAPVVALAQGEGGGNLPTAYALWDATALTARGQYADAIAAWQHLLAAHPDAPERDRWLYHLVLAHARTDQPAAARAACDQLATQYPRSPYLGDALVELYTAYLAARDEAQLAAIRQQLYRQWPQSGYVHTILVQELLQRAPWESSKALQTLIDAEQQHVAPGDAFLAYLVLQDATKTRLELLRKFDQHRFAADAVPIVQHIHAVQDDILDRLAWGQVADEQALRALHEHLKTLRAITRWLPDDSPTGDTIRDHIRQTFLATCVAPALAFYEEGYPYDPQNAQEIVLYDTFVRDHQPTAWLTSYQRIVDLIPRDHATRPAALLRFAHGAHHMASQAALQGEPAHAAADSARQTYTLLLQDYPQDSTVVAPALAGLWTLTAAGDPQDLQRLAADLATHPSPLVQDGLAAYYYALDTPDGYTQALAIFTALSEQHPQQPERMHWLFRSAHCWQQLQQHAHALAAYQRVIAEYPHTGSALLAHWALAQHEGGR